MKKCKKVLTLAVLAAIALGANSVYAEENLSGDINNDQKITVTDLSMLKSHIVGISALTNELSLQMADLNNDGKISMVDLSMLRSKLIGIIQEFLQSENEDIVQYLQKYSQFISEFEFTDPSKLALSLDSDLFLNYLCDNSLDELNITVADVIEIGGDLGYDVDKIKDIQFPLINLNYLYNDSLFELVFSSSTFKKIMTNLGYDTDSLHDYLQKSTPYISSINKIKENYRLLFGKEIPQEIISQIKNSKNYLPEYDAFFYTKPRVKQKNYKINNITGEVVDNTYTLTIEGEQIKSKVVLKRSDYGCCFVSIEK